MRLRFGLASIPISFLAASTAASQARIDRIIAGPTGVSVQTAGALGAARGAVGTTLQPGDMLSAADTSLLELRCTTKGETTYRFKGPFRVLIDVPANSLCHVNLLSGHTDVLAEEPTNTSGGTIGLVSKGTQYSMDIARPRGVVVCNVVVFEGSVSTRDGVRSASEGTRMQWTGTEVVTARYTQQDIQRSALVYASFDLAAARAASTAAVPTTTLAQLTALHYAVLANPTDTMKRVDLAKRQLVYKIDDQAAFNLKRANVTNDAAFLRYKIDPKTIRANPALNQRIFRSSAASAVTPHVAATPAPPARGKAVTSSMLRGGAAAPGTTSHDFYVLAKTYDGHDAVKARQNATRALAQQAVDGKLTDAELRELRDLLARQG